jgi:hypothetical protein
MVSSSAFVILYGWLEPVRLESMKDESKFNIEMHSVRFAELRMKSLHLILVRCFTCLRLGDH